MPGINLMEREREKERKDFSKSIKIIERGENIFFSLEVIDCIFVKETT